MASNIDRWAAIDERATLGQDLKIGPFAVIEGDVILEDGCVVGPHAYLTGHTRIGRGTVIHTGAIIGDAPQDLHYQGEKSYTEIGEDCVIREYVTIHRGTEEGSCTKVGNKVLLMAFSHLGHNCQIGDNVVIANATLLAGRVQVERNAFISAGCMVHQFVRIGRLAMIGGGNPVVQDVPPFCMLQEKCIQGLNAVGLRRANWSDEASSALKSAVKIYFFEGLNRINAEAKIRSEVPLHPEVEEFLSFVEATTRGITSGRVSRHAVRNNEVVAQQEKG